MVYIDKELQGANLDNAPCKINRFKFYLQKFRLYNDSISAEA